MPEQPPNHHLTQKNPAAKPKQDHAGVIAPPPVIYLCSVLIGYALHRVWAIPICPVGWTMYLGATFVVAAVIILALSVHRFIAAGTNLPPHRPTIVIVKTGPYRFSRNPIYLSFTLLHLGMALWVNSLWIMLMLVVTTAVVSWGVIAREERYLAQRFGEPYLQYKATVRRWL